MMLDQKRAFDEIVVALRQIPRRASGSWESHLPAALVDAGGLARIRGHGQALRDRGREEVRPHHPRHAADGERARLPRRAGAAVRAIDSPAIQWFTKPYSAAGRFSLKAVGVGAAFVLEAAGAFRRLGVSRGHGAILHRVQLDLAGFQRAREEVFELLRETDVGFVLVSSARSDGGRRGDLLP